MADVIISGIEVDAGFVIDDLLSQLAQAKLTEAALRGRIALLSGLLQARMVDGVPGDHEASESPTGANGGESVARANGFCICPDPTCLCGAAIAPL